jgi:predicted aspartyl protease
MFAMILGLLTFAVLVQPLHSRDSTAGLKSFYDSHRWFELRDKVARTNAPAFYKGAVATAFNRTPEAETDLRAIISDDRSGDFGFEARELLIAFFYRTGKYHEALAEANALLAQKSSAADIVNVLPTLQVLSTHDNQSIVERHPGTVTMDVDDENLVLPVDVNGISGHYILDNGFSVSGVSESEAQRLKLDVHDVATNIDSMNGAQVKIRVAVAANFVLAGVQLHNVAFYVLPDDQPPFNQLQAGRRGILGLPVILALGHVKWSVTDHLFSVLPLTEGGSLAKANMAFDGTGTLCRLFFYGKPLQFSLDLGAQNTVLYDSFAQKFPTLRASGFHEKHQVTGVGGSSRLDSVIIPSLTFSLGNHPLVLKPAHILLQDNNSTSDRFAGNLGMDLLNQAGTVEVDFRSMTLSLH